MLVGYARTSTADQISDLDAQARELNAAGEAVLRSGKARHAVSFRRWATLKTCPTVVTKPDRLARTTAELLRIEADLTQRALGW
jgi:DNA invertase Pin-like site-specific DNA recombinase